MTEIFTSCFNLIMSVFSAISSFLFSTNYPGLTISFGVLFIGFFLVETGFMYLDFFTSSSNLSDKVVRYK